MNGVERLVVPIALGPQTVPEFAAAIRAALASEPRVLVLEHRGEVFCTGLDLEIHKSTNAREVLSLFIDCLRTLRASGQPTVAIVDGAAIGGGVGLAAVCDLVIATERATFGMPEMLYGLVPATVMPFLLERLAPQKFRLAAMTARTFTAAEALDVGIVDVVANDSEAALRSWVRRFSRVQPAAVRALKQFTLPAYPEAGLELTVQTLSDPQVLARIETFITGGPAPWLQDDDE